MAESSSKVDDSFHQIVLLDTGGMIRYSCESIFPLKKHLSQSLLEVSPLLESIFPQLLKQLDNNKKKTLRYYKLDNPFPGLEGTYDFSFQCVTVEEAECILWNINDLSEVYQSIRAAQQKHNEDAISAEKLAAISRNDLSDWKKSKE